MTTAISIKSVAIDRRETLPADTETSSLSAKPSSKILQKIKAIASFVFNATLTIFFNWLNPSIFAVSCLVGAAFSKGMKDGVNRIKDIWQQNQWKTRAVMLSVAYMRLPIALGLLSCISGAELGISISEEAQKIKAQKVNNQNMEQKKLDMQIKKAQSSYMSTEAEADLFKA